MQEEVIYKGDKNKIIYRVVDESGNKLLLKGVNHRKIMLVDKDDVQKASADIIMKENRMNNNYELYLLRGNNSKKKLGTVMHFDSDSNYLLKCVELYKKIGVYCYPILIEEKLLSERIDKLTVEFIPDVVVVTGHDFYNGGEKKDINSYTNSNYFVDAIKKIKILFPQAIIIAGACQSNFEALVANGANFASSPKRKNVHVYDPVVIAISVCTTSFRKIVDFQKLDKYIVELNDSFGGVETFGKMRMLY